MTDKRHNRPALILCVVTLITDLVSDTEYRGVCSRSVRSLGTVSLVRGELAKNQLIQYWSADHDSHTECFHPR